MRLSSCSPAIRSSRKKSGLSAIGAKVVAALLFISSCSSGSERPQTDSIQNIKSVPKEKVPSERVPVGASGFTIELPVTHTIRTEEKDSSSVFYILPLDSTKFSGEAGIYTGPKPQVNPPRGDYTAQELKTNFLGMERPWIEYTMANFIQRETFIDDGNGRFIHIWCYADNLTELEELFTMINTIQR
jgi:hypothetical protein